MAYHDLMGDRVAQTSSFVNGGSTFSVGASYTRQARSGFDADGVMVKARYAF